MEVILHRCIPTFCTCFQTKCQTTDKHTLKNTQMYFCNIYPFIGWTKCPLSHFKNDMNLFFGFCLHEIYDLSVTLVCTLLTPSPATSSQPTGPTGNVQVRWHVHRRRQINSFPVTVRCFSLVRLQQTKPLAARTQEWLTALWPSFLLWFLNWSSVFLQMAVELQGGGFSPRHGRHKSKARSVNLFWMSSSSLMTHFPVWSVSNKSHCN